ncbi:hypothetical protein IKG54_00125 [Candidatus Saccharibacteria bacterium]|nr:hypothetical protein [Candidatus Saccharibacteria bacterium]
MDIKQFIENYPDRIVQAIVTMLLLGILSIVAAGLTDKNSQVEKAAEKAELIEAEATETIETHSLYAGAILTPEDIEESEYLGELWAGVSDEEGNDKGKDLPRLKIPNGVDGCGEYTSESWLVMASPVASVSTTVEFYNADGASLAFYASNGHIETAEITTSVGYPTVINYSNDEADFLLPAGEAVGIVNVSGKDIYVTDEQYNLLTWIFNHSTGDYLNELEIGKFGYFEDGLVALLSYLEDNGMEPDEDGIYWASPEGIWPREGIKLETTTAEIDGAEVGILQPTFCVADKEYSTDEVDYVTVVREWQPSKDQCYHTNGDKLYEVELADGKTAKAGLELLQGIMQLVQRGDERNTYCHLDPGYEAIGRKATLFYQEAYSKK